MDFLSSKVQLTALAILSYTLVRCVYLVVHRLYFSPLAKFPGPKLAAATHWYEFYHDYWRGGKYIFEIEKMHKKYGPIIRVNPDELAIHDPEYYSELYVTESKRRTESHEMFVKGIDFDGAHLLTTDHNLHRKRRKPLEPFFSRAGVQRLNGMLGDVTQNLESRIREYAGTGKPIRLDHAFAAYSGDIIGKICTGGKDAGVHFLEGPDFSPDWYNVIHMLVRSLPFFTGFPFLIQILSYIPESFLMWAMPRAQVFNKFKTIAVSHIHAALSDQEEANRKGIKTDDRGSIFRHIANSDMPESEKSEERLAKEAQVLMGGGTASTSRTIKFASFYILSVPDLQSRLRDELAVTMQDWPAYVPTLADLERLPLLQGIVKESLRLSYGVMHRLPRVSPDLPLQYKQWVIPPKIPVGMSAYLMHTDPEVYPDPFHFNPDRWIGDIDPNMNRNWVPFTRGSRNCLGHNLAVAEISLALAVLFRPGGPDMELFETDESDVIMAHDFLIPVPKIDTKGVRVLVR
ncbi:cytochrome P450 [Aaosphaeria arxii CBS 175.79]|uniref:Cytochrome P450 n=1 Tax=Aaosphaeria arxii CBS 175.79 TaxID=1450172 RepID=A0A6A5X728_9PLEO|nr:cytochrome P450 [Aaosphaeria arxii CBS 175.79]KAF2008686.1 cytochrome P450 [Aaosphaeria arxii CBS 175.79]